MPRIDRFSRSIQTDLQKGNIDHSTFIIPVAKANEKLMKIYWKSISKKAVMRLEN